MFGKRNQNCRNSIFQLIEILIHMIGVFGVVGIYDNNSGKMVMMTKLCCFEKKILFGKKITIFFLISFLIRFAIEKFFTDFLIKCIVSTKSKILTKKTSFSIF